MGEELGQSRLGGLRENSQTYLGMGCGLVGWLWGGGDDGRKRWREA
jgi:hypothetical protein